jgi:hypothetical protein
MKLHTNAAGGTARAATTIRNFGTSLNSRLRQQHMTNGTLYRHVPLTIQIWPQPCTWYYIPEAARLWLLVCRLRMEAARVTQQEPITDVNQLLGAAPSSDYERLGSKRQACRDMVRK